MYTFASIHRQNQLAKLVTLTISALLYGMMALHQTVNVQPEFYAAKLDQTGATLVEHGRAMQSQLEQLGQDEPEDNGWSLTLTEDQINGWLVGELPQRFPRFLPVGVHQPRVAIEPNRFNVACQYRNGNMQAVLTLQAESFLTNKPNEIGIRILETKIGAVPGLTDKAIESITWACLRSRLRIRWVTRDERPEAIIQITPAVLKSHDSVNLERIELADGRMSVAGRRVPAQVRPPLGNSNRHGGVHPNKTPTLAGDMAQEHATSEPAAKNLKVPPLAILQGR